MDSKVIYRLRWHNPKVEKYLTDTGRWTAVKVRSVGFPTYQEAENFATRFGLSSKVIVVSENGLILGDRNGN